MSIRIQPMRVRGNWSIGYALDYHTVRSVFCGHDEFGNPQFDTERTPMGELLYRLKYQSDRSALMPIIRAAAGFVRKWSPPADVIIPVLPSRRRSFQPVNAVCRGLSRELRIPFRFGVLKKTKETPQLKTVHEYNERLKLLDGAYDVRGNGVAGQRVLLLDDLFRSGATLNAITDVLIRKGRVRDVFVLALTRTRRRR